jgi:sugar (pentulose or hexulose) kinase
MAENEPLILTFDFGTQSVRAAVFDKSGNALAIEKEVYDPPYYSEKPNYAEQDPDAYYSCLCACTKRLAGAHGELLNRVKGITLTCFRDSAVLLDKQRKVIRPMILWLDQRTAECRNKLPLSSRLLFTFVGKKDTIEFNRRRSISNWLIENEPDNWAKVDKYVAVSTYFIYRLTGELRDSSSNQAGHYPIDFKHRQWYENPEHNLTGQVFSIPGSMLSEIVPEGSLIGSINEKAAIETGLPVGLQMYACGSDKSCETLGLGVIDDNLAAISYGTASTVETTVTKYVESEPFLPGYPSCIPNYYNMDIQIYRGYWMVNWFLREFGAERVDDLIVSDVSAEEYNSKLAEVPPGCDGLVLQPYWGPGLSRPLAKGAIIGFGDSITREHFYRAIIEGIAYALREGLEHFEKKIHHKMEAIRISGGGSQSPEICQITADIFGKPVYRVQTCETSSLGAAIAGFLAIGEYKTAPEAIASMVHVQDSFTPDAATHEKYNYLYENVYEKMYPQLKGIYRSIKDYNHREERLSPFRKFKSRFSSKK